MSMLIISLKAALIENPAPVVCPADHVRTPENTCRAKTQQEIMVESMTSLINSILGTLDSITSLTQFPLLQFGSLVQAFQPTENKIAATVSNSGVTAIAALQCKSACTFNTTYSVALGGSKGKAKKPVKPKTLTLKPQKLSLKAGKAGVIKAVFTKAQLKQLTSAKAPKLVAKVTFKSGKVTKVKTITLKLKLSGK
jgi:hypothetical protein